jgi:hypothetical protein
MPSRTLSDESYIIDLGDEVLGTFCAIIGCPVFGVHYTSRVRSQSIRGIGDPKALLHDVERAAAAG